MLTFDIDALEALIRRCVREELAAVADGWLTSEQAAQYLGTSASHIRNLVSDGKLPRHGEPGTGIRLRRGDLDAYIATRGRS